MKPFTTQSGEIIVYDLKKLYNYGLNRLSTREYSRKELQTKMRRFQSDLTMVEEALNKLTALGYLSDTRRASAILRQRQSMESINKTKNRMAQKGVSQEEIAICVEEHKHHALELAGDEKSSYEEIEADKAAELLGRKFRVFNEGKKLKMQRFLLGRGFRFDTVNKAFRLFEKQGRA